MDTVTTCASHVGLPVGGTLKIRMRSAMAAKTPLVHNLWFSLAELEDLRNIATRFHMFLAGSVGRLHR